MSLNYISQGTGLPLIFQHGLTANVNQASSLLGGLEGIHLFSIDCPGHGSTELPNGYTPSFNNYADTVITFMDQLNIDQAIFGGISMGSGISINIALRYPDRVKALILVRPAWVDQTGPENLKILLPGAELIGKPDGKAQFQQLPEFKDIVLPTVAQSVLGVFAEDQQPALSKVIKHMVGDRPFQSMEQLYGIKVPCLILGNDHDPLHPFEMAKKIHQYIGGSVLRKLTSRYIDNDLHREQVRECIQEFVLNNN